MAFNVGSFVGGMFDGLKAGQDFLKARNDLKIQMHEIAFGEAALKQMKEEGAKPAPQVKFTPTGDADIGGSSGSSLPPEATSAGGSKRGYGAPTPEMAELIQKSAEQFNLPVDVFTGLLGVESNFNPNAVSHAGAKGIAQFIDSTARGIGLKDPFDWRQAIPKSAELLRQNLDRYGGDASNPDQLGNALRAYNAGFNQSRWNNPETRAYVPSVLARAKQFSMGSSNRMALPEVPTYGGAMGGDGEGFTTMEAPPSALSVPYTPMTTSAAPAPPPPPIGLPAGATFGFGGPMLPRCGTQTQGLIGGGSGGGIGEPAGAWAGAGGDTSALGNSVPTPVAPGNVDLYNRPLIQMPGGKSGSVYSMSFGTPQGEVLVPQISDDGRLMSPNEAIANFHKTGKHLGIFRNPKEADAFGKKISRDQERLFKERERAKQQSSGALY